MVWSPEGDRPPCCRHLSKTIAVAEAERLAGLYPGKSFFVLKAKSVSRNTLVTTMELKDFELDDQVHF